LRRRRLDPDSASRLSRKDEKMMRIAAKTRLNPGEVIRRAVAFFGPGGCGLAVTEQSGGYACFEGGGGDVEVSVSAQGKGASVELVSREWDYQVKQFLGTIS
jgi:hypothetical protein